MINSNYLKRNNTLNETCKRLILVQQELSRGMFELEPDQEMFDLLFQISQEVTKVHSRLIELYSYMEQKTCINI